MDAYLREMHLGLGCAIENMMTAPLRNGFEAELRVARAAADRGNGAVRGDPASAQERAPAAPRYAAIAKRHTNGYAYDPSRTRPGISRVRRRPELSKG